MEEWKDGRKNGRLEEWKGWKIGRMEDWKGGRLEGWKAGRLGRVEDWEGWKISTLPLFHPSTRARREAFVMSAVRVALRILIIGGRVDLFQNKSNAIGPCNTC
jgi:hypothetical protein